MQSGVNINQDLTVTTFEKYRRLLIYLFCRDYRHVYCKVTFNETDDTASALPKCQATAKQNCSCWYYLVLPLSILVAFIIGTIVEKNINLIENVSKCIKKKRDDRGT